MADRVASHYSENLKLADAIADKLRSVGKELSFPKISSDLDSHCKAESSHH
jgi:hypothetical protein